MFDESLNSLQLAMGNGKPAKPCELHIATEKMTKKNNTRINAHGRLSGEEHAWACRSRSTVLGLWKKER